MKIAKELAKYCKDSGYVTQDQLPWLQYILEKRLSTILIFFPVFTLGACLTSPVSSCLFLVSFLFLRERTNGFHADTFLGCFFGSLLSVLVFLGLLIRVLTPLISLLILIIASILIITMSPYMNPQMHLTPKEASACAVSARKRLILLDVLVIITYVFGYAEMAYSILLGISMTATTLIGAKILTKEDNYERTAEHC